MNMNLNINFHKNLKKEFLTKSLVNKNNQSNFYPVRKLALLDKIRDFVIIKMYRRPATGPEAV